MNTNYYQTKKSVEEYIKAAEGFDGKKLINRLKNHLSPKSKVLELGTGPGIDWEILSNHFRVIGSDFSLTFLEHLKSKHPNGEFYQLDASTLEIAQEFDGIYSNKVLHHLTDNELNDSIKKQAEILNPSGIICHSFWEGKGSETFNGLFVNYHTENELRSIIDPYFEVLLIEPYLEFEDGDSLLLIGRKTHLK